MVRAYQGERRVGRLATNRCLAAMNPIATLMIGSGVTAVMVHSLNSGLNILTVPLARLPRRKALASASAGLQSNKIELSSTTSPPACSDFTMPPTLIATANKMIE